jgi:glycosyltransferase involved in cell wall biosynthesis
MKISFATTAYQESRDGNSRGGNLLRCISPAISHESICEIVVVNDSPEDKGFVDDLLGHLPKVRVFHNQQNLGVFLNKIEAICSCTSEWVCMCDSDNYFPPQLLSLLAKTCETAREDGWILPSFGKPNFDYRHLAGNWSAGDIGKFLQLPMSQCCLNTGNQTVHRDSFANVFGSMRLKRQWHTEMPNPMRVRNNQLVREEWRLSYNACDSMLLCMTWLQSEGYLSVLPGYQYLHSYDTSDASNFSRAPETKWKLGESLIEYYKDAFSKKVSI